MVEVLAHLVETDEQAIMATHVSPVPQVRFWHYGRSRGSCCCCRSLTAARTVSAVETHAFAYTGLVGFLDV